MDRKPADDIPEVSGTDVESRPLDLLLTDDELIALTEAKTRPAQMAWLDARGFHYEVGAKGGIKVLRGHVIRKMGGVTTAVAGIGPDVDFFRTVH